MTIPSTITIDGPAGSGKSVTAALLADMLDFLYFDTGVMYRAVTWAALDRKIDIINVEKISHLAERLKIEVTADKADDGRQYTVLADGQDITWHIRTSEVDASVSAVSSHPRVRTALTDQQRRIASAGSIVMVGRDIGRVVLPEAELKIFLQASAQERAKRRYKDYIAQGHPSNLADILAGILERDRQDRENPVSPLIPADDAIVVDNDHLNIEETLAILLELVNSHSNEL